VTADVTSLCRLACLCGSGGVSSCLSRRVSSLGTKLQIMGNASTPGLTRACHSIRSQRRSGKSPWQAQIDANDDQNWFIDGANRMIAEDWS